MRILFCHWKGFPFGGGEIYLFKLFRLLLDEGHHIAFLTQADGRNRKMDGVAWYEIPPAPGVRNVKAQWEMVSAILARERPDVVHLHETFGFLGPWVLRKIINCYPAVTTIHFAGVLCPKGGRFSTETGICLRKISPNCIRCCTGLRSLKDMLLHTGWLIALQKAAVTLVGSRWLKSLCLENGFSPNRTHLLPPYWHEPVCGPATPHKNKDILFVGRIRKDKGVFDLLQALADLQNLDWRLVLAGKMDPEEQVEAYAAGMGLQNRLFFNRFCFSPQNREVLPAKCFSGISLAFSGNIRHRRRGSHEFRHTGGCL